MSPKLLSELFILRGVPRYIRSDNAPEFIAEAVQEWTAVLCVQESNFTNKPHRMEKNTRILDVLDIIAKFAGIAVLLFGAYQYWGDIQQEKKNKSYNYFDRYLTGSMLKSRSELEKIINEMYSQYNSDSDVQKIECHMIDTIENKDDNRINYEIVIDYFEAVHNCTVVGGCNRKVVLDLFKERALSLIRVISPVVEHFAKEDGEHGQGLKCIATGYQAAGCLEETGPRFFRFRNLIP